MKKKILSLAMAAAISVSAVACGSGNAGTTGTTVTTAATTTLGANTTTADIITTIATKIPGGLNPDVAAETFDPVTIDLGGVAELVYNPLYCDIEYKIESGVGSKKNITLAITMKDGYVFDGWSKSEVGSDKKVTGGPMANGASAVSTKDVYTFEGVTASKQTVIYANYSAQIEYDPNGGTIAKGDNKEIYTQKFSMVGYKSPNTLPEQGYFTRAGYTLVEYNTKADGTGEAVSLGSKIGLTDSGKIKLYCIWEKQAEESLFTVSEVSGGVSITKYNGERDVDTIAIPDTIGGKKVVDIAENAFKFSNVKRVILSKNVTTVADNAFASCKKLETFVMFDSVTSIRDKAFVTGVVKNLRVNAVLNLYNNWTVGYSAPKADRLIWAKANGKKVIAIYGGSGSLFGWDCEAIEAALGGEYVVVNMGTNANATAAMFFDYFEEMLDEGDIVLWSPEPGEWTFGYTAMGSSWSANSKSWEINASNYDIFRYMDVSQYTKVFDAYTSYASLHKNNQKSFDAFATSVSPEGDAMDKTTSNGGGYSYANEYERREDLFTDGTLDYMASLVGKLTSKGVRVLHTYAVMDENGKDSIDYDYITKTFEKILKEKFTGIEIISDIKNCFVPSNQISDSAWHLTREGAETRTANILKDIKKALGK